MTIFHTFVEFETSDGYRAKKAFSGPNSWDVTQAARAWLADWERGDPAGSLSDWEEWEAEA